MKKAIILPVILFALILVFSACSKTKTNALYLDIGGSEIYSDEELNEAVEVIKNNLSDGRIIESILRITYCGDTVSQDNLDYCNILNDGSAEYTSCAVFKTDFITTSNAGEEGFNENETYYDFAFYLAKTDGGNWEIVTSGYA